MRRNSLPYTAVIGGAARTLEREPPFLFKDQLWLTNPRDTLHHGERAANKQHGPFCHFF